MVQMKKKTDQNFRKRTKRRGDSQPIKYRFKTQVIRMLTEMIECGRKIEEKVKAMQSEIKKSVQGTNSEGKETGTQINDLEQKEEINIQPEQSEEIRIQKKVRRGLGNARTT